MLLWTRLQPRIFRTGVGALDDVVAEAAPAGLGARQRRRRRGYSPLSRNRSASSAAMQPKPAEVIACR
jgi:hypothetical protein